MHSQFLATSPSTANYARFGASFPAKARLLHRGRRLVCCQGCCLDSTIHHLEVTFYKPFQSCFKPNPTNPTAVSSTNIMNDLNVSLYQCKLDCWLILSALQISRNEINEAKSQCQTVEFHKEQCLRLLAPWIQSRWWHSMTLTCVGPQVSPECSHPQRRLGTTPDGTGQNYHHGSRIILGSVTGQDYWLRKAFDVKWLLSPIFLYFPCTKGCSPAKATMSPAQKRRMSASWAEFMRQKVFENVRNETSRLLKKSDRVCCLLV